ncbi:MAG TPA: copper oxidase [Gemmatimonas sp.]|uniref:copper oxidase n=1 Tax=Gemmatimonas sp. TaxID=1962908 RepID=UPI002ED9CE2E
MSTEERNPQSADSASIDRRSAVAAGLAVVAGAWSRTTVAGQEHVRHTTPVDTRPLPSATATLTDAPAQRPGLPGRDYTPVITPNGTTLPFRVVKGVKIFHLVAESVAHEFAPGLQAECWGYNGRTSGPTIEAVEGDRVRIYVTNRLPAATSVHWHGILLPSGMDGVSGLSQAPIPPGATFKYEFTLRQHGTFMYHSHRDEMTQIALGMMGMFVVHPRAASGRRPDKDFVLLSSEWRVVPGTKRPDPNEMVEFNVLTFNGKAFPGTAPLMVQQNDRVRIRLGNLSPMSHHSIHIHGHAWTLVGTDGGDIPESARWPEVTQLVPVGNTRTLEFVADNPGDWALHCHMTHHTMTQMGHSGVNVLGVDPAIIDRAVQPLLPRYMTMATSGMAEMGEMGMPLPKNSIPMLGAPGPHGPIDMGGMFTVMKVRERLQPGDEASWWEAPPGTLASAASDDELSADGIDVHAVSRPATIHRHPGISSP